MSGARLARARKAWAAVRAYAFGGAPHDETCQALLPHPMECDCGIPELDAALAEPPPDPCHFCQSRQAVGTLHKSPGVLILSSQHSGSYALKLCGECAKAIKPGVFSKCCGADVVKTEPRGEGIHRMYTMVCVLCRQPGDVHRPEDE